VNAVGVHRAGRGSVRDVGLEPVGPDYVFSTGDTLVLVGKKEDLERAIGEMVGKEP
jgi:K+/H+ antiporter YhaU regulatory subunit KhtT